MSGTDQFGVILKTGRDSFGAVSVAFDKLNHLLGLFSFPPGFKGLQANGVISML